MAPTHPPPAWVADAVFYQIFPDRFARSGRVLQPSGLEPWDAHPTVHGYKGGDLYGVIDHLDHIASLGVNALYFNPIFSSASNHRYHTHDYFQVDPMLGGDVAFRALLDAAHERGMRVIIDGVFNHASRGFLPFNDLLENGEASPYRDWFHVEGFPLGAYGEGDGVRRYRSWWNLPALPKLNTDTPEVREYLYRIAEHWLRFGADGWRLDVPNEIEDDEFWREFRRRCQRINPEAYIVGEIWTEAERWLQGDQFDGVMNYQLGRAILGFASHDLNQGELARSGYHGIPALDAEGFAEALERETSRYAWPIVRSQLNLLDSHDSPRLACIVKSDRSAVELALLWQFTLAGAPCIYYGSEVGLAGGMDPACREGMPWGHPELWDRQRLATYQKLIKLRHEHPALRGERLEVVFAEGPVVAVRRRTEGDDLLVVANQGLHGVDVGVALEEVPAGVRQALWSSASLSAEMRDGELRLHLQPRSGGIIPL